MSQSLPPVASDILRQKIGMLKWHDPEGKVVPLGNDLLAQLGRLYQESGASLDEFAKAFASSTVPGPLGQRLLTMLNCPQFRKQILDPTGAQNWPEAFEKVWQDLQDRIKGIVADLLEHESSHNGSRFRELCRLAHDWDVDPETFRRLLVRARMSPARASEIKTVLETDGVCRAFLKKSNPISWRTALARARQAGPKPNRFRQVARRLVRLVLQNQHLWAGLTDNGSVTPVTVQRNDPGRFTVNHPSGELILVLKFPAS